MTRRDFARSALLFFGSQLGLKAIADAEIVKRLGFEPRDSLNLLLSFVVYGPVRLRISIVLSDGKVWCEYIDLPARQCVDDRELLQVSAPLPFHSKDVLTYSVRFESPEMNPYIVRHMSAENTVDLGEIDTSKAPALQNREQMLLGGRWLVNMGYERRKP